MRNYVIINGVNSLTIQGLAINNLPPITKPMIRTQREEIDGRDGDIVTELGYSAYDKQMEIGLWGTYDINDIIKYFTGEGTIVFSNEEDKYYNFKILDQIDYEKLLKFKTATITLHCQPFKYPVEEEPVEAEMMTITGTGETITLNNTEEALMTINLKGNTSQDTNIITYKCLGTESGDYYFAYNSTNYQFTMPTISANDVLTFNTDTLKLYLGTTEIATTTASTGTLITMHSTPNPDYSQDIHVVSGNNSINVMGKNMADVNDRAIGYFNADGSINTYYGNNSTHFNKYMLIDSSNYATLSFKAKKTLTIGRITTYTYDEKYNPIQGGGAFAWGDVTINEGETKVITHSIASPGVTNAKYFRMAIYAVKDENNQGLAINTKFDEYIDNFQVEIGNVASPIYAPYKGTSYPINLGDIELCKIGDYQDSIVKDNGKWYLNKQIGKVVLNGSESWSYTSQTFLISSITDYKLVGENICISSHFISQKNVTSTSGLLDKHIAFRNDSSTKRLYIKDSDITSASDFATWLSNNNVTLYYILQTPTYTEITDSTLISQLNALAKSYASQTNISQTNDDAPFELDVSVTFLTPMEINNIGNIYAKPILTIEGTGNIGVVLNDIQILDIDLTNNEKIAIDVTKLEAYNPDDDTLLNRLVTGDYMKLLINEGENTITFTGDVSGATLTNYIRWI